MTWRTPLFERVIIPTMMQTRSLRADLEAYAEQLIRRARAGEATAAAIIDSYRKKAGAPTSLSQSPIGIILNRRLESESP